MRRRWLMCGAVLAVAAALAGCGASKKVVTTTASTASTSSTTIVSRPTPTGGPSACTSYGNTWLKEYNQAALQQGSPIHMVSACCGPATKAGRHHCFLKVALLGTKSIGCETVDLGPDGTPATIGRHENCALHK